MHVVRFEPEIPPNTGNVARLCAATCSTLHLIEPFGFQLDDRQLKRAGMDHWQQVTWHRWANWAAFAQNLAPAARLWFIESNGPRHYAEITYQASDYLVFGREPPACPRPCSPSIANAGCAFRCSIRTRARCTSPTASPSSSSRRCGRLGFLPLQLPRLEIDLSAGRDHAEPLNPNSEIEMGSACLWRALAGVPPASRATDSLRPVTTHKIPHRTGRCEPRTRFRRDAESNTRDACAPHSGFGVRV